MSRIVIDPVTRIEGHLRVEAQLDGGKVAKAWSSTTMWRGLEKILVGRDPRDAGRSAEALNAAQQALAYASAADKTEIESLIADLKQKLGQ